MKAVFAAFGIIKCHQFSLPDSGKCLHFGKLLGAFFHTQSVHTGTDGTRGNKHNFVILFAQSGDPGNQFAETAGVSKEPGTGLDHNAFAVFQHIKPGLDGFIFHINKNPLKNGLYYYSIYYIDNITRKVIFSRDFSLLSANFYVNSSRQICAYSPDWW